MKHYSIPFRRVGDVYIIITRPQIDKGFLYKYSYKMSSLLRITVGWCARQESRHKRPMHINHISTTGYQSTCSSLLLLLFYYIQRVVWQRQGYSIEGHTWKYSYASMTLYLCQCLSIRVFRILKRISPLILLHNSYFRINSIKERSM